MRKTGFRALARIFLPMQKSLLARIVASFFLLSSLIVGCLVVFGYSFFISGSESRATEQMEGIVSIKAATLERWVAEQMRDVLSFAEFPEVRRDMITLCSVAEQDPVAQAASARLRELFTDQLAYYSDLKDVFVLSARGGLIVFSTDPSAEGQYRVLDTYFTEGKKGTYVQNVYPSPMTLQPTITVSTPIGEKDGQVMAVLAVNLDLDSIDKIIEDRTGLGQGGVAYLVDRYNVFVSSTRFGSDKYPRGVHSVGIDMALGGRSGSALYQDYDGVPVIGVYRWIPERNLALIAEIPQSEVFDQARSQTITLITIGLAMVLIAAGGVYLLGRRIATPIIAMRRAALKVSGGDLSAQVPVLTHDEIGELAGSFNHMTVRVKSLYDELLAKEEHFRSLIETSTDIICIFDSSMNLSFVSPSVSRILGYSRDELLGRNVITLVHPEDDEKARLIAEKVVTAPGPKPMPIVLRVVCKDGGVRLLEITGRNLLSHSAIQGVVLTARDITERQQLEDKLLQAQKMEAVGRLAGGIAHDFNNLLTAVLGYSEVLLEEGGLETEAQGFVAEIKKAATRAASLTQQLLAYSRKQMLQPKTVDLNALVKNMQDMLGRLIGEDVEIITSLAPDLMHVKADPNQLEQVIMNLVVNARDAMPSGGTIVFSTANATIEGDSLQQFPEIAPGNYVVLGVSDTGIGMDAETTRRIFDPFFTTKGVGKGTGLGLSTVYGIVKQSGGHITVHSEPGRGSTFRIYLPATADFASQSEGEVSQPRKDGGSEAILIVEDEEAVRRIIEMVLVQAGYSVHSEGNPAAAIRYAQMAERIDFLVTDVILPGLTGKSMADVITERHPRMKVLFISGYTEDAIVQHGVLSEGISFLQKPFQPRILVAKVRELLDRGRAGPDAATAAR
jgi:PAS domain S-box-containing protein